MIKPVLVVLAAGLGSRYGGNKQIDPMGPNNQLIIDYSIFDARRAGFETVIFVIKEEMHENFKIVIGDKISQFMNVKYAFQNINDLPQGFSVPENREKPWGTAHAVMSARDIIKDSFVVINADDFYGANAFKVAYDYLICEEDESKCCMVGYELKNTVTDYGSVSRGVCETNKNGNLTQIIERTKIVKNKNTIQYTEDDKLWAELDENTTVSMNFFGFRKTVIEKSAELFKDFLSENIEKKPLKCEFYIPLVVSELINSKDIEVKVLNTADKWYGVTYQEDKPSVQKAIKEMTENGEYPEKLWT